MGLTGQPAACFRDTRQPDPVVHSVRALVGQRIPGLLPDSGDISDLRSGAQSTGSSRIQAAIAPSGLRGADPASDRPSRAGPPLGRNPLGPLGATGADWGPGMPDSETRRHDQGGRARDGGGKHGVFWQIRLKYINHF